ncbi:gliding motility-associated-like protein [Filimonas zeae]|uniref:PKD domain-containing protein n=1 Tax=Filimonas zeae TaxID=1737353 RepID=A0A917IX09_9BACT|nr:PKD domain-containing protein [Filimonas zeae]MDR6339066.1 gliding motility-associated-like protein [Filimonas zeae]GGH65258.1 hypothetical protein GCM10011379_18210 [Filimonas zeae]
MKYSVVTVLLLLVMAAGADVCAQQRLSNKGKDFWVGYGPHQFMESILSDTDGAIGAQEMVLYLSAEQDADVTVTIDSSGLNHPFGENWSKTYHVNANQVLMTDKIPKSGMYNATLHSEPVSAGCPDCTNSEGLFTRRGIHITSTTPIVAYAHIYAQATSGATMLMPVETWGYTYTSLNSKQMRSNNSNTCYSFMYVIAQHDNTVIEIIPSVDTRNGHLKGVPYRATLQKGHIYQVIGAPLNSKLPVNSWGEELTGTTVRSIANDAGGCYPIAVFSGSSRTENPCGGLEGLRVYGGDNDMQQVFPRQAWGKRYLTAPTSEGASSNLFMNNIYKIQVQDVNTVVKKNGVVLPVSSMITPGNFYYYESSTADYIEADKPVMVAQYMSGGCVLDQMGDPEMFYISPMEQGIKHVGFFRNNLFLIKYNYLTLIIPDKGVSSLKIDGKVDDYNYKYAHPNKPGYSVVVKRWVGGQAQCIAESDSAFTAITYGLGGAESYGYNAGTYINNLNASGSLRNEANTTSTINEYTCAGTPVELSLKVHGTPATRIEWKLSSVPGISPAADVVQAAPVPAATEVTDGETFYTYRLPGTYTISQPGTYILPVLHTNPSSESCNQTDTIRLEITVKPRVTPPVQIQYTGCTGDTLHLRAAATSGNGYTFNRFTFTFPGPHVRTNEQKIDTLLPAGSYALQYRGITTEGCTADSAFTVAIHEKPVAAFDTEKDICLGEPSTFTDKSAGSGVALSRWTWLFGDGITAEYTMSRNIIRSYQRFGNYLPKLAVTDVNGCVSDTFSMPVAVHAVPDAAFTPPAAICMPGAATFTNQSVIEDNSALRYTWNMGDGSASLTTRDVNHTYAASGSYVVKLTVTSTAGCTDEATHTISRFYTQPVAAFTIAPERVCQGKDQVFTDASTAAGSTVTAWSWTFGDGTTADTRNPVKRYTAAGNYAVKLTVTNAVGCTSVAANGNATVYVQPQIDAGPSFTILKGNTVTLAATAQNVATMDLQWTPAALLTGANTLTPSLVATETATYTLTATGKVGGCVTTDQTEVLVYTAVTVPNAFTPNNDGIHDTWEILYLDGYPGSIVQVFDRYGRQVFIGQPGQNVAWKGTYNGKPVPTGTYYYIVDLKNGAKKMTGSVTVIR